MDDYKYQKDFSQIHPDSPLHDTETRTQKALKTICVLEDYFGDVRALTALDIGCSTGLMTSIYAEKFKKVIGIDIDKAAIDLARENNTCKNLEFQLKDSMNIDFQNESFDVIICTHVYEHVPDARQLMHEIYRLLKYDGVCYFAAGNRLILIEGHYKLPLLSIIPKCLAHIYLRLLGKGEFYYEKHLTLWGLRKLVSKFSIIDYTIPIIKEPEKFHATEMIKPGSFRQKLALIFVRIAYWLSPAYIWLLKKK